MSQNTCNFSASRRSVFLEGARDGIPIGLGYMAVAFSLGIAARTAGLTPVQGFFASLLTNASAGEYVVFSLMIAHAAYLEVVLVTIITNARYLLMSCALSQRLSPSTSLAHRLMIGFGVTDELFGIAIARPGFLNPYYSYGALCVASPCWALGTALGIIAGNMLPARIVSALSVALFGMFLAVIIPPARKNRVVAGCVLLSFAASYAASVLPALAAMSEGTRTIILTVVIAAGAAALFPVKQDEEDSEDGE